MIDILFLYPPYKKRAGGGTLFPLGIGYLISGIEKNGLTFDYVDCQNLYYKNKKEFIDNLAERIRKNEYLVIAISCITTAAVPFLKDIIVACRLVHKSTPIVLGGQLVSIDYVEELFFEEYDIDAICKGDGDYIVPDLVRHIKNGNSIDTFLYVSTFKRRAKKNYITDINELPFPYRNNEMVANSQLSFGRSTYAEKSVTMITSRGCFYKCYYCVSGCNTGRHFQKRSWENIVSEIKYIQEKFQVFSIVFYDDCFFFNKKTVNEDVEEFIYQLKKQKCINFKWQMELRADVITTITPGSWKKLYENGCTQINIGIESCYNDSLDFLGKTISTQTIKKAFEILYQNVPEIILTATYIIGGPNSDYEHIIKIAEFSQEMKLMYIRLYPLELHPGTKLYENYYGKKDDWYRFIMSEDNPYSCMYFESDTSSLHKIMGNINKTYKKFYLSEYWDKRAKVIYGERYNAVRANLFKTYKLEE